MKVKVTKSFWSLDKATDVHPRFYQPGDVAENYAAEVALQENWGAKLDEDTDGASAALAAGVAASVAVPAEPVKKARLASPYDGPDHEGNPAKFAEGAIVEGAVAEFLIAQGLAIEVAEKKPATNKAKGAAPSNK